MKIQTEHVLLGARIRDLRQAKKISQEAFGRALGLHQAAVSRVEQGIQGLTPSQLGKASKLFDVSADTLLQLDRCEHFWVKLPKPGPGLAVEEACAKCTARQGMTIPDYQSFLEQLGFPPELIEAELNLNPTLKGNLK